MDIHVVGRHTKVAEGFREKVLEKLQKVEALDPRATRVDVHVVHERNPRLADERERIELTVHGKGPVLRAEAAADDRMVALELAADRLVEQLRKSHERRAHRHHGKVGVGHAPELTVVPNAPSDPARRRRRERRAMGGGARGSHHGDPARRHPDRHPEQDAHGRPDDDGRGHRPDGARRPRLLPLPRLGVRTSRPRCTAAGDGRTGSSTLRPRSETRARLDARADAIEESA